MKRVAALDLGTNTFHLIIAEINQGQIQKIVLADQKHVKLGEGGINNGKITEAAFERGLDALSAFSNVIRQNQVDIVKAVGTAALRTAVNGPDFIKAVKQKAGMQIEIIDGDREADLIYSGVRQAVQLDQNSLIMDIGGGSVEFIFADARGIEWKKSYPIGAAKLMEMFHHSDPISGDDCKSIVAHLDAVLSDLFSFSSEYKPKVLIGSAGAFETFAELCQMKTANKLPAANESFDFDSGQLGLIIKEILDSTHQERLTNEAILSVRKDMIVVAALLTQYIINKLKIESVKLSVYALKEGLLLD